MRTLCDVCESAAAILFCAADEAALCCSCDHKVHMCNKLANRHVRVGLADPSAVPRCGICESSPAFFYCEVDGSSLCLQCDMKVHVGGKRTHGRFLLLRQKVEFPGGQTPGGEESTALPVDDGENKKESVKPAAKDSKQIQRVPSIPISDGSSDGEAKMEIQMFDLNMKPNRQPGQASNNQPRMHEVEASSA